jgi:outer membrane protein assembly factor BamB
VFVQAGVALHALDAETGERQWVYRTNSSFRGMTVTDDLVVFASRKDARGGGGGKSVIALDGGDGSERWQTVVGGNTGPMATPVVADATVYAVVHSTDHHEKMDAETRAFALNSDTGDVRWNEAVDQPHVPFSLPAVAGDSLYYGTRDLVALDTDDGSTAWTAAETVDAGGHLVPALADDAVFVTHDGGVTAFEQLGGATRWHHEEPDTWQFPVVAGDDLLVAARDGLHAYDVESGDERFHALRGDHSFLGSPIVVDGTVYVSNGADLLALE